MTGVSKEEILRSIVLDRVVSTVDSSTVDAYFTFITRYKGIYIGRLNIGCDKGVLCIRHSGTINQSPRVWVLGLELKINKYYFTTVTSVEHLKKCIRETLRVEQLQSPVLYVERTINRHKAHESYFTQPEVKILTGKKLNLYRFIESYNTFDIYIRAIDSDKSLPLFCILPPTTGKTLSIYNKHICTSVPYCINVVSLLGVKRFIKDNVKVGDR